MNRQIADGLQCQYKTETKEPKIERFQARRDAEDSKTKNRWTA